jgi:hypothetical protein
LRVDKYIQISVCKTPLNVYIYLLINFNPNPFMKSYLLLWFSMFFLLTATSQNSINYADATTTTGSLTDMSSGTTLLVASDQDDVASLVTNIGFDFFFMGTWYAQFSVNSNGPLRLGTTVIGTALQDPLGQSNQALITAYSGDLRTHAGDGKVHYKVTGTAPNRVLIVEWLNLQSDYNSGGIADLTYQVRLYETTGVIEFVYGTMNMSAAGALDPNSNSPQIGFSSNNSVGAVGTFTAAYSGSPAPAYNYSSAAPVNNSYTAAGGIPVLTSGANGLRRTFSLTPPIPSAPPSALSFTGITVVGMTLNWTDNASNETGYAIYRSTDGINYSYINQVAANATSSAQTGLLTPVTYYWKVVAVTEGGVSNALSGSQATLPPGDITSNGTGGGLWSNPATWSGGVIPTSADSVTIKNGDVVTIDMTSNAYALQVGEGGSGTLQFEANSFRTLTVVSNVAIAAGGIFQSATTSIQTNHVLFLGGNLTNNGTLDFSTNSNTAGAAIAFTGANNSTFGGTGGTTNIRQLTIDKASSTSIVELEPTNFTVRGSTTDNVVGGFLLMSKGIFKISGSFTYTGRVFPLTVAIPASFGVWLNNPNFTIAGQGGNAVINGMLRITSGTWNFGTTNTSTLTGTAGASFILEGGTLNAAGRFNPSTAVSYNQSGGVFNVAVAGNAGTGSTNGSFYMASTSIFTMSGGTINLVQASTGATPVDWNVTSASFNYTGGTLQVGTSATATNYNFRLRGNVPALIIDNTTNNKTATFSALATTYSDVTVNSGATLVSSGQIWRVVGSSITNNGTITSIADNGQVIFMGPVPQSYTGSGTATIAAATGTAVLMINNPLGFTIDPSANGITVQRVDFFRGGITNANKITLGGGGTTNAAIQFGIAGGTVTAGNFDVAPVFNIGTGGLSLYYVDEPTARTTGVEVVPGRTIASLYSSNLNGLTINGGDLTIAAGTTPMLIMVNGNITTGSNTLTLGASAALPGTLTYTSGTIIGKFKRWIAAAAGNSDFPVGIASAKRTASINFTTAPTAGGTLTAEWVSAYGGITGLPLTQGVISVSSICNDGYWRIVAGDGLNGGVYIGTFTATGISQVTDVTKLVLLKRADGSAPWLLDGTHITGSGSLAAPVVSRTGMSGFSEFAIGADDFSILPVNLLSFSARKTGNSNQLTWTTADEQNNLGFEVQRSVNGFDYVKIGFVYARSAGGNSITEINYDFTDNNPQGNIQYYRLRQVDINNQSKFSAVVTVRSETPNGLAITGVFPNPAETVINLQVSTPVADKLAIIITDINGKPVLQQIAYAGAGSNTLQLNVTRLSKGTYFIKMVGLFSHQIVQAGKLIKQ